MPLTAENAPTIYAKAALLSIAHVQGMPAGTAPTAIPTWMQTLLDFLTTLTGGCGLTTGAAVAARVQDPKPLDPFRTRIILWRHGLGNDAAQAAVDMVALGTTEAEFDAMFKEAASA